VRRAARVAVVAALALGACGSDAALPAEVTGSVPVAAVTDPPPVPTCTDEQRAEDPTRSYAPEGPPPAPGAMPAGSTMREIQDRGRLVVGVSADTLLFGARNPLTGAIEGFDIDVLRELASAIFGPDGGSRIEYRVITYAQRLPALEAGEVDVVAHTMTINCDRWLRIAFSTVYYDAGQVVLVRSGSGAEDVEDLVAQGARVCAPLGSTNIEEIERPRYAGIEVVGVPDISDCLVAIQQGRVDAVTGDDTVLAGFAAQDPNLEVVGEPFTEEPYGLGFARGDVDLVRFANAVLEDLRADGRWAAIYRRWLIDSGALPGAEVPPPPPATYGRQP